MPDQLLEALQALPRHAREARRQAAIAEWTRLDCVVPGRVTIGNGSTRGSALGLGSTVNPHLDGPRTIPDHDQYDHALDLLHQTFGRET